MPITDAPWAVQEAWAFEAHNDLRLVSIEGVSAGPSHQATNTNRSLGYLHGVKPRERDRVADTCRELAMAYFRVLVQSASRL
jgi:hypothetical protein